MEIVLTPVQAFRVDAYCECGGELKCNGIKLTIHPPKYQHECDMCGKLHKLDKTYPTIEYR